MKKYTTWKLTARMANYIHKNGTMSPLNRLEYVFLRRLYRYVTKQHQEPGEKDRLYKNYIELINICYFPNREEICPDMVEIVYKQCNILLDRDFSGPRTFMILNDEWHWIKMHQIVDLMKAWSLNPLYHGYACKPQFFEAMGFLRKQFNENQQDMYANVGKWPRKFRKRFNRD
jgi:hypothetical protein